MAGKRKLSDPGKGPDPGSKKRRAANELADPERRKTRSMARAPCKATLGIVELLEMIISYLPATTLLTTVRRVSHFWKNVADHSPTIQKKLWLRPIDRNIASPTRFSGVNDISGLDDSIDRALRSGVPVYSGVHQGNNFAPPLFVKPGTYQLPRYRRIKVSSLAWDLIHITIEPSQDRSAPSMWLKMQITEPAITTVWLAVTATSYDRGGRPGHWASVQTHATVRAAAGVTFGMIMDVGDKMIAQFKHDGFSSFERQRSHIRICFIAREIDVPAFIRPPRILPYPIRRNAIPNRPG